MKKNEAYFLLVLLGFALFYLSCDSKTVRDDFSNSETKKPLFTDTQKQGSDEQKNSKGEVVSVEEKEELKEKLREDFNFIIQGFYNFKESDKSFSETYELFKQIGVEPDLPVQDDLGNIGMRGTVAVNGLRYFMAKFSGVEPVYLNFELEPVKGAYQASSELVKEIYPNLGEPCFTSNIKNAVAYQVDDYLLRVAEVTYDDVEMGHPNKPRSKEDIGSVEVIIEQDIHGICGKAAEDIMEEEHDH